MRNVLPNSSATEDMDALKWSKANLGRKEYVEQLQQALSKYGDERTFYATFEAERNGTAPARTPVSDEVRGGSIADIFAQQADVGKAYEAPAQPVSIADTMAPAQQVARVGMPEAAPVPSAQASAPVPVQAGRPVPAQAGRTPPAEMAQSVAPEIGRSIPPQYASVPMAEVAKPTEAGGAAVASAPEQPLPTPQAEKARVTTPDDAPWLAYGKPVAASVMDGPWSAYKKPAGDDPSMMDRAALHVREGFYQDGSLTGQTVSDIERGSGPRNVAAAGYQELDRRNYGGDFPSDFEVPRNKAPVTPQRRIEMTTQDDAALLAQSNEQQGIADASAQAFNERRAGERAEFNAMPDSDSIGDYAAVVAGRLIGNAPSPENLIPTGRAATLPRTFAQGALVNAGVNALVEPGAQRTAIESGERTEYSFEDGLVNVLIGGAVGGGINAAPDVMKALRGLFAKRQGVEPEAVVPPSIDEIADAAQADPEIARVLEASGLTKDSPSFAQAVERVSQRRAQEQARISGGAQPLTTNAEVRSAEKAQAQELKQQQKNIKNTPGELTPEQVAEARANGEMPPVQQPPDRPSLQGEIVEAGSGATAPPDHGSAKWHLSTQAPTPGSPARAETRSARTQARTQSRWSRTSLASRPRPTHGCQPQHGSGSMTRLSNNEMPPAQATPCPRPTRRCRTVRPHTAPPAGPRTGLDLPVGGRSRLTQRSTPERPQGAVRATPARRRARQTAQPIWARTARAWTSGLATQKPAIRQTPVRPILSGLRTRRRAPRALPPRRS
jgi:hypothetical protein